MRTPLRALVASLAFAPALALASCSSEPEAPAPADGPLASHARSVSAEHGVPGDLVLAVAAVEGGLKLARFREVDDDDEVPVAGVLELRRGAFDSLSRGAELSGRPEAELRADTDLGTLAGVLVLRDLAGASPPAELAGWKDAVEHLSGHREPARQRDYAARVFRVLRTGGTFAARDGETVRVAPHPEIPVGLTLSPPPLLPQGNPDSPLVTEWVETPMSGPAPSGSTCTSKWDTSHDGKDFIAIHDTEGGWDASLATLQNDGCKSVQYMIDKDGSRIAQFIPETAVGYHVGNYYYNQRAIGIEHVGFAKDPNGYSNALYDASVKLVKDIASRHGIAVDRAHIFGHYQVPDGSNIAKDGPPCSLGLDACETSPNYGGANNHRDPGYNWQWCQYMEKLGGSCECNDAWSSWNCTTDQAEAWRCNGGSLEKQDCTGGCVVMPVGTPDQCNVDPQGAGGSSSSGGSGGSGGAGETAGGAGGEGAQGGSAGDAGAGGSSGPTAGSGGSKAGGGSAGASGSASGGSAGAGGSKAGAAGSPSGGSAGSKSGGSQAGSAGGDQAGGAGGSAGKAAAQPTTIKIGGDDSGQDGGGCSTSPGKASSPLPVLAALVALAAGLRRKGRRSSEAGLG